MTKIDEIMELVFDYGDSRQHETADKWSVKSIKSAIEELAADAEYGRSMRLSTIVAEMKGEPLSNADIQKIAIEYEIKNEKLRQQGICPDCKGEGEQGGQFCGGYWKCEIHSDTGKFGNLKVNATHDYKKTP